MNCNKCNRSYSTLKNSLPRVLINCGHTLCESCIEKTFDSHQLCCPECNQISYGMNFHQYPVNATLLALLKQKEEDMCKVHNQKLQAFCEKDSELLCLSCVIGGPHKSHKISSVAQKVAKDRSILRQCMKDIEQSTNQIQSWLSSLTQSLQQVQHSYKDYLLDLGLCFTNLHQLLTQLHQRTQQKLKCEYQQMRQKYQKQCQEMKEKREFMRELGKIYDEVICLPNIQYLHQDNKRLFIIENCKFKKNKSVDPCKFGFNKLQVYQDLMQALQQVLGYEKKLQGQGQCPAESTPVLKKRSSRNKQPTVLQVNLNQQYRKHFKSTVQLPVTSGQHTNTLSLKTRSTKAQPTPKQGASNPHSHLSQLSRTPKQDKNPISQKRQPMSIGCSSQSQKIHQSFHSDILPASMVNSFMESSNQSLSIRNSQADFTIFSYDQRVYHFAGFNHSSVEFRKVDDPNSVRCINACIERSKAQCAVIPAYNQQKCLIFGGKSITDQKLDTFLQYDLQTNKWSPSPNKLSQQKSGFGSVVKQNKLFIAGGSNSQRSLRIFEQYRISTNSMVKTDLHPMNHCRDELGMVLGFDGKIYACGGINQSGSVLASCERYNQGKAKWEMVASMTKPRRCFSLVSLPHGIYAIGGYDGSQYLRDVELYDFSLEKWIKVASMSEPRFGHTALVTADFQNIIVSGGFYKKPLRSTEIFDVINEKWMEGTPLQAERFLHCSVISNF